MRSKERKKPKKPKETKNQKGGFRAKWGGPLGHLTWPLNHPKKDPKKKIKKKKPQKQKILNNELFSYQWKFLLFWWVSKISFFWQLGQKSAHPKKHYKNRGFSNPFFGKQFCVTKRPFLDKKPNPEIPVIIFFCLFLLFRRQKTQKLAESRNPHFYSVLANQKREFSKFKLKTQKIEKPIFCTLFWKRPFSENRQKIGNKKKHTHTQW